MSLEVNGMVFKSMKAAEDYVRGKLTAFDGNDPLWPALLDRHPERNEKRGPGIKRFYVSKNPLNPKALQLNIERLDGSCVDISWRWCLKGAPRDVRSNLLSAMRNAVIDQVTSYREACGVISVCPCCGLKISGKTHVDHEQPTFAELANEFLSSALKAPDTFDDCPETNMAKFRETDRAYSNIWQEFHRRKAKLRLICANCNLRRQKSC